jgi:hypothetical protein
MNDPLSGWPSGVFTLTKAEARKRLWHMINVAINRKAGSPDEPSKKWGDSYQAQCRRDQEALRKLHHGIRVYQFDTREVRRRFGHLLSRYDD